MNRRNIMNTQQITSGQVLEAAQNSTSITQVAKQLGCCGSKLSGGTAKKLRTLAPELDGILKANRDNNPPVKFGKHFQIKGAIPNPYSRGLYQELFRQGSRSYQLKKDLIASVAQTTGKKIRCVEFAYAVLSSRNGKHSSNNGKSTALIENGLVKLIPIKRRHL